MPFDFYNLSPWPCYMQIFLFLKTFAFFDMLFFFFFNILSPFLNTFALSLMQNDITVISILLVTNVIC